LLAYSIFSNQLNKRSLLDVLKADLHHLSSYDRYHIGALDAIE
jgi:hypothetical protein